MNTKGQLDPESESPSQGNAKEKERTCLRACLNTREEAKLPLFARSDYLLENQCCLNSASLFPKTGVLPHTIPND